MSLKVEIDQKPISYIEISQALDEMIIQVDPDKSSAISEVFGSIPSYLGQVSYDKAQFRINQFKNIDLEMCKLSNDGLDFSVLDYQPLLKLGLSHTVQYPVCLLAELGYLTQEQIQKIHQFIEQHLKARS
jgi:hypothetical protein